MRCFSLCLILAAIFSNPLHAQPKEIECNEPFRILDIPAREHGYGNFKTQIIRSQGEMETFLKTSVNLSKLGWNNREAFITGLMKGKIDFKKETLVLLRDTEGSGSNKVSLLPPQIKGKTLICPLNRVVAKIGTADIADYCFAVVVDRGSVEEVHYLVNGKLVEKLAVAGPAK